jgi:ribonuclease P protein component
MGGRLDMIRSATDFRALQSEGRSRVHPLLVMRYRRNGQEVTRYGISTGRRIGSAVLRNQIRRRLRTVMRELGGEVEPGWDVLIISRPPAASATQSELRLALERLLRATGLMEGTGSAK